MTSSHGFVTEQFGTPKQHVELQVTVALHARVGCAACSVIGNVGGNHVLLELFAEIEHVVIKIQLSRSTASVFHLGHRTASGIRLPSPELHGDGHYFVAILV